VADLTNDEQKMLRMKCFQNDISITWAMKSATFLRPQLWHILSDF